MCKGAIGRSRTGYTERHQQHGVAGGVVDLNLVHKRRPEWLPSDRQGERQRA